MKRALHSTTRKPVILVGGCFDLLHAGHINLLKKAHNLGGLVVVGVLSDRYVKSYKGEGRPINNEKDRLVLIQSVRFVDRAFICDMDAYGDSVLKKIRPDIIIIGSKNYLNARQTGIVAKIKSILPNVRIVKLPRLNPSRISTTHTIKKIMRL